MQQGIAHARRDAAVSLARPGVYYLGASEGAAQRRGWLEPDAIELRSLDAISERWLLLQVQRRLETGSLLEPHAHQLELVRQRVAELAR